MVKTNATNNICLYNTNSQAINFAQTTYVKDRMQFKLSQGWRNQGKEFQVSYTGQAIVMKVLELLDKSISKCLSSVAFIT